MNNIQVNHNVKSKALHVEYYTLNAYCTFVQTRYHYLSHIILLI